MSQSATTVNWSELQDAYGPASEVPLLLERIRKAKGNKLGELVDELYSRVLHQGTIYSASPPVARELIALAGTPPSAEHKSFCYDMLSGFATAARKAIADGRAIPCHAGGDPVDGNAIRQAILESQASFLADIDNEQPQIRKAVAELLPAFADGNPAATQCLRDRYPLETDEEVRSTIVDGLIRTSQHQSDWLGFLEEALGREAIPAIRFSLRHAQICQWKTAADPSMQEDLVTSFVSAFDTDLSFTPLEQRFLEAARLLGPDRELATLLRALDLASHDAILLTVAQNLLRIVFADQRSGWDRRSYSRLNADGSQPPSPSLGKMAIWAIGTLILWKLVPSLMRRHIRKRSTLRPEGINKIEYWGIEGDRPDMPVRLTDQQRTVIERLAAKDELWSFRSNLWELFGLPGKPQDLSQWVAERSR